MMKKILILIAVVFSLFACEKKESHSVAITAGDTIPLFLKDSNNVEVNKRYKIGNLLLSLERIDRDAYEVAKVKKQMPQSLSFDKLPDSIRIRIAKDKDDKLLGLMFGNGKKKYFKTIALEKEESQEYRFLAYYPKLNVLSVTALFYDASEVLSYNMHTGSDSIVTPEDFSPDASFSFSIVEDNEGSLSASLYSVIDKKTIIIFSLDDIESGYLSDAYETCWLDNTTVLLKVEANNQDQDEYWKFKIER